MSVVPTLGRWKQEDQEGVQGPAWPQTSLGYMRYCFKKLKPKEPPQNQKNILQWSCVKTETWNWQNLENKKTPECLTINGHLCHLFRLKKHCGGRTRKNEELEKGEVGWTLTSWVWPDCSTRQLTAVITGTNLPKTELINPLWNGEGLTGPHDL